jgi:hypothetical protein
MTPISPALAALEADLERARRSLDAAGGLVGDPVDPDLAADILGLLGALHHLVRRYHDIIDATGERHR